MPKYYFVQDRWCWCGRPAAFQVATVKRQPIPTDKLLEPVCSEPHAEIRIKQLRRAKA